VILIIGIVFDVENTYNERIFTNIPAVKKLHFFLDVYKKASN